jgi:hypothetical protein
VKTLLAGKNPRFRIGLPLCLKVMQHEKPAP